MVELIHTHKGTVYGQRNGVLIPVNTDGLVGYWPMTEGSGLTAYDESKNGNDSIIYGPVWTNTANGKTLDFDGVDDYIDVGSMTDLQGSSSFSITVWIKHPASTANLRVYSQGKGAQLAITEYTLHKANFGFYNDSGNWQAWAVTTSDVDDNTWHFLVGTYDGTNIKLFVDTTQEDSIAATGIYNTTPSSNFLIGVHETISKEWYNGTLDEVRIYDRALSAQEITNIYEKTRGLYGI